MTDKTPELLNEISKVSTLAGDYAFGAIRLYNSAVYEYERLSCEDDFLTGPEDRGEYLEEDMEVSVTLASEYLGDTERYLGILDQHLLKLIQLRAQLADETGIPIGGKQWVRLETYDM